MMGVVITGAAVVSPIGNGFPSFVKGIADQRKGVGEIRSFNTDYLPFNLAGEVRLKELESYSFETDRKEVFLEKAMDELFASAKVISEYPEERRMLFLGAGLDYVDLPGITEFFASEQSLPGDIAEYIKISQDQVESIAAKYGLRGHTSVNVATCVASAQAIGFGFRYLKNNPECIVISGGFDSNIHYLNHMGFYRLGALSTWEGEPAESCRPFDKKRCGTILGEGAALVAMQRRSEADPQDVLAEICGYASTMDGYLITDPDPSGTYLANAAKSAIEEAGISPDDIDCVHLHGTGTIKNDAAEATALRVVFGSRYDQIPVYSIKSQSGHLAAACSAVELLAAVYSLKQQVVPVTVNYQEPAHDVGLRVVKGEELKTEINFALKLNSNIGGQNTAIVLKRA